MKYFYYSYQRPSVYPNVGMDDYGNEYITTGAVGASAWYFIKNGELPYAWSE
jgi:hypothetical protein